MNICTCIISTFTPHEVIADMYTFTYKTFSGMDKLLVNIGEKLNVKMCINVLPRMQFFTMSHHTMCIAGLKLD